MDLANTLTVVGLLFDIAGITLLFFTTSISRIEEEISLALMEGFTRDFRDSEFLNYEEHLRELNILRLEVKRNRRLQRIALALVILGFGLQCAGVLWPYLYDLLQGFS